jgi:hypothetical protein
MEGRLFLDVVVLESSAVLKLLSGKDESLLIWGNSFLVLDLGLDGFDGVSLLNLEGDGLTGKGLDEDLHTTTESEDQVEGGLLLDVVVLEGTSVFELLSGEDESLLIWGNSFLILDLGLDGFDRVGLLNFEGDGLSGEGLDEDLHSSSKSEDEMEGRLLLDVVILEGSAIFELLSSEDESLLIWGNSFLILNLGLDGFDGIGLLNLKSDGLSGESLNEDLHTTSESEDEMESRFLLDVIVLEGSSVFELLTGEDKSLLIWGNSFLILDLGLDGFDGVGLLDFEGDSLTGEGLDKDLHTTSKSEDEMEGRLLLDVVILESTAILELLTGEDKSLLIWGNTFLVLDLSLDGLDGVGLLDFESDSFTGEGLNENLHVKLLKIYYNLTIKRSLYSRIILKFINRPIKLSKLTR